MTLGVVLASTFILAGLGVLQPASQDQPGEEHPPAGHPSFPELAADWPKAKAEDVASVDAIVKAMYESTAGEKGQARDWDRFRSLFLPNAQLVATRPRPDGSCGAVFLKVDEFVAQNRRYIEKGGFVDSEIARRTETFAHITQVWSTYQTIQNKNPTPYVRGINSIQLLKDGNRYWIVSLYWECEREKTPLPEKYLQSAQN
ncbi:MAG: hypothetical protein AMXMBFR58_24990 [Phycisphaerae bacterium]